MVMKAVIKCRFNTSKEKFESFGNNMYLAYLPYSEDEDTISVLSELLSRKLGVVPSRVSYAGKDVRGNWVFELL